MIPSLVTFSSFEEFGNALRAHYQHDSKGKVLAKRTDRIVEQARILHEMGLPPIPNPTAFGILLGVSPRLISSMALRPTRYWRIFTLPKRSGGVRVITAPRAFLKTVQIYILRNILHLSSESPAAFGFTSGRSIFENAANHVGKKFVWNTDLVDFFPSCRHHAVKAVFQGLGFDPDMSTVLASLCTYGGRLPQGAPTSPKLSNIIFLPADEELTQLSLKYGLKYSRYADDVTFSSDNTFAPRFFEECDGVFQRFGFFRNVDKTRLHGPNEARYVTGLVVNEKVQPNRQTRRILRAMFRNIETGKIRDHNQVNVFQGWAAYVHAYNPELGRKYLETVKEFRITAMPAAAPEGGPHIQS